MDQKNMDDALEIKPKDASVTPELLMKYHPDSNVQRVPDPYFEGGFDHVFELIRTACLEFIKSHR